jgi:hypothetical protein
MKSVALNDINSLKLMTVTPNYLTPWVESSSVKSPQIADGGTGYRCAV